MTCTLFTKEVCNRAVTYKPVEHETTPFLPKIQNCIIVKTGKKIVLFYSSKNTWMVNYSTVQKKFDSSRYYDRIQKCDC